MDEGWLARITAACVAHPVKVGYTNGCHVRLHGWRTGMTVRQLLARIPDEEPAKLILVSRWWDACNQEYDYNSPDLMDSWNEFLRLSRLNAARGRESESE